MHAQKTVYCGKLHRTADGVPLAHACRVLLPEFLEAERRREYLRAVDLLEAMPLVLHQGVDGPGAEPLDASVSLPGGTDASR